MKLYEIYFSPTGGTKKVTDILVEAWRQDIVEIDLSMDDLSDMRIEEDAICIIGVPVFGGRIPELAIKKLCQLKGRQAKAIVTVVYGNRAYEDALLELQHTAEDVGFHCIAGIAAIAEHSIMHQFAKGRPDQKDRVQLLAFMKQIRMMAVDNIELIVPGNQPYKEYKGVSMIPITANTCIACGICSNRCPAHAIPFDHPQSTDAKRCISCMRCIAVCPVHARYVEPKSLAFITEKLAPLCLDRKQNECFLGKSH